MKDIFDVINYDWDSLYSDNFVITEIPEPIRKLISPEKKKVEQGINELNHLLDSTNYVGFYLTYTVPIFWKLLKYHIDHNQMSIVFLLFEELRTSYLPEDWSYEPFGYDFDQLHTAKDNVTDYIIKMFEPWDQILAYIYSESELIKNFAVFFIRHYTPEAKASVKILREILPDQRNELTITNILYALALLDCHLGDQSDLTQFLSYLHPQFSKIVRNAALIAIFIITSGNVPDSIAKSIIHYIECVDEAGTMSVSNLLIPDVLDLDEWNWAIIPPSYNPDELKFDMDGYKSYEIEQFYGFYESIAILYFVQPGANSLLFPTLLKILEIIPKETEKVEYAVINIINTLSYSLFPQGLTYALNSESRLGNLQICFINRLFHLKYWDRTSVSAKLNQISSCSNLDEFASLVSNSIHSSEFLEQMALLKFQRVEGISEIKYNDLGRVSEFKLFLSHLDDELLNEIDQFKYLTTLSISGEEKNPLIFLENIPQVKSLRIKDQFARNFNPKFQKDCPLESLILNLNHQESIPVSIQNLSNLKELTLIMNNVLEIPDIFQNMPHLVRLFLSINKITTLPDSLCECANLRELDIENYRLNEHIPFKLPPNIGKLQHLEKLRLDYVNLQEFPPSFSTLKNLHTIIIYTSLLQVLPDSFRNLGSLITLDIRQSKISEIPDSICNLNKLEHMQITLSPVSHIPFGFFKNPTLKNIKLPESIFKECKSELLQRIKDVYHLNFIEIEKIYSQHPNKWYEIYENISFPIKSGNLLRLRVGIYALFFLQKGVETQNYVMVLDSLQKFATLVPRNDSLYEIFEENILIPSLRVLMISHPFDQDKIMVELNEQFHHSTNSNEEQHNFIKHLNDEIWYYLSKQLFLDFCNTIGKFIQNYGLQKTIKSWECYGLDIIASTLTYRNLREKLIEAKNIFESIKKINENWLTQENYELVQKKLIDL